MLTPIVLILFAYLLGSIPTGLLISKMCAGVDPRHGGSGNIGATNVFRTTTKTLGLLTLVGDILKGLAPVLMALHLMREEFCVGATALAVFLGHLFPLYLGFRGGKGVATALGILLPLAPWAVTLNVVVFIGAVLASRMVSVGSLSAAGIMPIFVWLLGYPRSYLVLSIIVAGLIFYRHKDNIQRLVKRKESKLWARS